MSDKDELNVDDSDEQRATLVEMIEESISSYIDWCKKNDKTPAYMFSVVTTMMLEVVAVHLAKMALASRDPEKEMILQQYTEKFNDYVDRLSQEALKILLKKTSDDHQQNKDSEDDNQAKGGSDDPPPGTTIH